MPLQVTHKWQLTSPVIVCIAMLVMVQVALPMKPVDISDYEDIPIGYGSYSLFLICNPEWIRKLDDDLNAFNPLYRNYRAFGKAIGSKHLAVWFWKRVTWETLVGDVSKKSGQHEYDVDRAIGYCSKYKLRPSRGPYILVTTSYPDSESLSENFFTIDLGDLNERSSLKMLSTLADQVVSGNLNQEQLDSEQYWSSWASILDNVMLSLGALSERVHVSLDTKFVKITFGKPDENDGVQAAPAKN